MTVQKRIKLLITGKVQGVGFRFFVKEKADTLGVRGYVRNLKDGSVYATAQGRDCALDNLLNWCYRGPKGAYVKNIEKKIVKTKEFSDFKISY